MPDEWNAVLVCGLDNRGRRASRWMQVNLRTGEFREMPRSPQSADPFGAPAVDDFDIDLSEIPVGTSRRGGTQPPPGIYVSAVAEIEKTTSQSSGNLMWVWTFQVAAGPHRGKSGRIWTVLQPNALWKMEEVLRGIGIGQGGEHVRFTKNEAIGKLALTLFIDDSFVGDDGVTRASSKLDSVLPLTSPEYLDAVADQLAELDIDVEELFAEAGIEMAEVATEEEEYEEEYEEEVEPEPASPPARAATRPAARTAAAPNAGTGRAQPARAPNRAAPNGQQRTTPARQAQPQAPATRRMPAPATGGRPAVRR